MIENLLFLNRGDSIRIEKFNNIINFELPTNNINFIAGNDYDYKESIICSLNTYFNDVKENTQYIEYNGNPLKIFNKDLLINKKEYRIINLDFLNLNIDNELKLNKNSLLRELLINYLNLYSSKSESYFLINSILAETFDDLKNTKLFQSNNAIELNLHFNEINPKIILDNCLSLNVIKNENNIPLNYLSFYEQSMIIINFIEELIELQCIKEKIILIINNIDCRLSNGQIYKLYKELEKLSCNNNLYIYVFTNNKNILSQNNNLLKTVLINSNNSIIYFEDLDDYIIKINENYPTLVSNDTLTHKVRRAILNNLEYIGNFVSINDENINNIEDMVIIKILNDIFDFKYNICVSTKDTSNCFNSYLTTNTTI